MENLATMLAGLALLVALALCWLMLRRPAAAPAHDPNLDARLRELIAAQNEIAGRFGQAIATQAQHTGDLQRAVVERLEALDQRLGVNLKESAAKTAETLGGLQDRLKIIDE